MRFTQFIMNKLIKRIIKIKDFINKSIKEDYPLYLLLIFFGIYPLTLLVISLII